MNSLCYVSGWRLRKQFFLIKPTDPTKKDIRNILTWVYDLISPKKVLYSPYCACKIDCHVMHQAYTLSTIKMNNDRADGHCYGFVWILRSQTFSDPYFFFRNRFYLPLSPHCPKMNNKSMWEPKLKKIQDFCPRDMESCHLAAVKHVELYGH